MGIHKYSTPIFLVTLLVGVVSGGLLIATTGAKSQFVPVGVGIVFGFILIGAFVAFGWPTASRIIVRVSGDPAEATIQDMKWGRYRIETGSGASSSVSHQEVILQLEVQPPAGQSYQTEDRLLANTSDLMRLQPGCKVQVRIDRLNAKHVVVLPATVTVPLTAPTHVRARAAMADFAAQLRNRPAGQPVTSEEIAEFYKARGLTASTTPADPPDPAEKLRTLKQLLDDGLITPKEYEQKKADILSKF
jgi:hypothetical protein